MLYSDVENIQSIIQGLGLYKKNNVQVGKFQLLQDSVFIKGGPLNSANGTHWDGTIHVFGYHVDNSNIESTVQSAAQKVMRAVRQEGYKPVNITTDEDVLDFLGFQNAQILPL